MIEVSASSQKCWTRLVWWLIDICILNAFRLWQVQHPDESHLTFRMTLAHELMECLPADRRPQRTPHPPSSGATLAMEHYSIIVAEERDCVVCSRRSRQRKQTNYTCAACRKHMCLGDCFSTYHRG